MRARCIRVARRSRSGQGVPAMEISYRLGLIGDVHASDETLACVLGFFGDEGVEDILCVGDIVDGPGDPDRCVELLVAHDAKVVRGNHDRWILTDTARDLPEAHLIDELSPDSVFYLRELGSTLHVGTPFGEVLLCHGVGEDDMVFLNPDDAEEVWEANFELQRLIDEGFDWVVGGHTHHPMDRRFGALRFINPGTIGAMPMATCAMLDVANDEVQFFRLVDGALVKTKI